MTCRNLSISLTSLTFLLLTTPLLTTLHQTRQTQRQTDIYRVRQKSSPLKFFAVFSATVRNFNLKFSCRFIYWIVLHVTAEQNLILLKNDKVKDFLTWPPIDFSALKNVKAKDAISFSKTGHHVTANDVTVTCW